MAELKSHGLWTEAVRDAIKRADGSVQGIAALPAESRELFRTAWELPQRALIDMAAARAPFVDQSQSLNLFLAAPSIGKLSSMYLHAWKSGLKTTYYLRSRPATRIAQATVAPEEAPQRRRMRWRARWRTRRLARPANDRRTASDRRDAGARGEGSRGSCSILAWT